MVKKELLPQRMHSKIQDARSNCNHSSRRCIVEVVHVINTISYYIF
ncbi:hypothetical protein AAZX31_04G069500 [Glycine max]